MDGCRTTTTTDAGDDDDASNDVIDATEEEFNIVGRYARYDEVRSVV